MKNVMPSTRTADGDGSASLPEACSRIAILPGQPQLIPQDEHFPASGRQCGQRGEYLLALLGADHLVSG